MSWTCGHADNADDKLQLASSFERNHEAKGARPIAERLSRLTQVQALASSTCWFDVFMCMMP